MTVVNNTDSGKTGWVPPKPPEPENTFGYRLWLIRRHLELDVDTIAKQCGIKRSTWAAWENDYGTPRNQADVVSRIAKETGCSPTWLMWGQGSTSNPCLTQNGPTLDLTAEPVFELAQAS